MLPDLLHGDERKVWGDGGYQGQTEAIHKAAPKAQDMTSRRTKYKDMWTKKQAKEHDQGPRKSQSRASFSHPEACLRIYQGSLSRLWKNHQWLCAAFALVNLYQHRNRLAPQRA